MPERPLLVLPAPTAVERLKKPPAIPGLRFPGRGRQAERLNPQFTRLSEAFERRRTELRMDTTGLAPEEVVVLEVAGPVADLVKAATKVGLEWLSEIEGDAAAPDDDFYVAKKGERTERPVPRRLFLVFSDDAARGQLLGLWDRYKRGEGMPRGLAPLRTLFERLDKVRPWQANDRLEGTGILEDWQHRVQAGQEAVVAEIELWHRGSAQAVGKAEARVRHLVEAVGGAVLKEASIKEIAYHGLLVRIPIQEIRSILETRETRLVQCEAIQFFRPTGQAAAPPSSEGSSAEPAVPGPPTEALGEPVAALLDGVPLANHRSLADRLTIDDPDDFTSTAGVQRRHHGTAMASLVLHGDLNRNEPALTRKLYVRPVLEPAGFAPDHGEHVPEGVLWVDLLHRAVRRLRVGEAGAPPALPQGCIVNLSIADRTRPFIHALSAPARLLDWLSHEHGILFLVSAGNYIQPLDLGLTETEFKNGDPKERQQRTLRALRDDTMNRRILSPAEAINALTIGARHDDASVAVPYHDREPVEHRDLPSPLSPLGPGFGGAVKPELLVSGGRALYAARITGTPTAPSVAEFRARSGGPGIRAAAPGPTSGDLGFSAHSCGTSNATALATRAAVQLFDVLEELRAEPGGGLIDAVPRAVWLKALLVHGASWSPEAFDAIDEALKTVVPNTARRNAEIGRFLGYGIPDTARVAECTLQRVTALSGGRLAADEAHVHRLPIPESLRNVTGLRRLVVTLAWLTPVNPRHQRWGVADLWFGKPGGIEGLGVKESRIDVDAVTSQRGTVQHEIFEGTKVATGAGDGFVEVQVNCRAVAGDLNGAVPYALAMTLEVAPALEIEIYEQVKARVQAQVQVQAGT